MTIVFTPSNLPWS